MKTFALSALSAVAYAASDKDHAARVAELNAGNPHATFSVEVISPHHKGGCYRAPSSLSTDEGALSFTADELRAAEGAVAIDWREHGAVGPVQQQHPFGTCWAFSMTAVTEAVNVIQGGNAFEKLSEQMTVSCVPAAATGDNSDVLWSWALANTGGKYQTEAVYAYNRTCNSYRETQVSNAATADAADAAASDDVALCSLTPFYRHTHTRSLVRALFLSLSLSLCSWRPTASPTATRSSATSSTRRPPAHAHLAGRSAAPTARHRAASRRRAAPASPRRRSRAGGSSRPTAAAALAPSPPPPSPRRTLGPTT